MAVEIAEQPEALGAPATARGDSRSHARLAEVIRARAPRFVLLAARGTSDHAALYAKYLVEVSLGLPAGLASPSTMTAYGARPDLSDVLLLTVSQSGGSPDLIETVRTARAGRGHDAGGHEQPGQRSWPRRPSSTSTSWPAPSRRSRPRSRTRRSCWPCGSSSRCTAAGTRSAASAAAGGGPVPGRPARRGRRAGRALPVHRSAGHHRARLLLPDGPRDGAEAHGDLVRGGARVLRRRPAARTAGDDRPRPPGHRDRARTAWAPRR